MSSKKSRTRYFNQDFPARLKSIRGALGQREFAEIIGVGQSAISNYEKGRIPEAPILQKIADYGGTTVEYLLRGEKKAGTTKEHAPDLYEARPRELNLNYLTQALILARKFSRAARPRLPERSEAELAAYLYEYWQETGLKPDQVVVKRYAALIKNQED
ncbi:MAG: helix-turn-helix transcriptional regulator [Deltaproteobacteria bacterium]|nr:helix-turn-helix transcriptional regulator [Deltaproteobacteria bacterium]